MKQRLFILIFLLSITIPVSSLLCQSANNIGTSSSENRAIQDHPDYRTAFSYYNENDIDAALVYFRKLTEEFPRSAEAWTWYAECLRRTLYTIEDSTALAKGFGTVREAALHALQIDAHHALAHTVLGDIYNPQYATWNESNSDASWKHYTTAVSLDENEGNAWLSILFEAMRREDTHKEKQALQQLYTTRFIPEKVLAETRFQMKYLPERALYITYGDWDTYPGLLIQENESFRPDVALVNASLLNMPWYVLEMCRRYELPLPMSKEEIEDFQPYENSDGEAIYLADEVLQRWFKMDKSLGRPITIAATCGDDVQALCEHGVVDCGGFYTPASVNQKNDIDAEILKNAIDTLHAEDFGGPNYSKRDKSSVRRSVDSNQIASVPYWSSVTYIRYLAEDNQKAKAQKYLGKLRAFTLKAGMSDQYIAYLDKIQDEI